MKIRLPIATMLLAIVGAIPAHASLGAATIMDSPNPPEGRYFQLSAVSCTTTTSCSAVGTYQTIRGINRTLAMRMNGQGWSLESTPNTASNEYNRLEGVDCVDETFCMAVGNSSPDYYRSILTMVRDGSTWSIVPGPATSPTSSASLTSVSCVSNSMCVAVGTLETGVSAKTPLILRWDGSSWSHMPAPSLPSDRYNILNSVSCISATFCTAVGKHRKNLNIGQEVGTLVITWNGSSWSNVNAPLNTTLDWVNLASIDCASRESCVSVGDYRSDTGPIDGPILPLILRWDGTNWTRESPPAVRDSAEIYLHSVSCTSPSACAVIGLKWSSSPGYEPLAITLAGAVWTEISVPKVTGSEGAPRLSAVSCTNDSHCVAVGNSEISYNNIRTTVVVLGPYVAPPTSAPSTSPTLSSMTRRNVPSSKLVKAAGIGIPKGAKVTLTVSSKYRNVCKVVGSTVRTTGKGTCPVKIVVTTKAKKRTSKTVTIKVG